MMIENYLLYIIVFLYGSIIGSFLNVCIFRIPSGMSIVSNRSHCMTCDHELRWYDLVPVFSWLLLRGRCRYCGIKISCQYMLVELLNGTVYVITFVKYGFELESAIWCVVISSIIVSAIIDMRYKFVSRGINTFIFIEVLILHLQRIKERNARISVFIIAFLFLLFLCLEKSKTEKKYLIRSIEFIAYISSCFWIQSFVLALIFAVVLKVVALVISMIKKYKFGWNRVVPYMGIGAIFAILIPGI